MKNAALNYVQRCQWHRSILTGCCFLCYLHNIGVRPCPILTQAVQPK
jgi:hypothetical protein